MRRSVLAACSLFLAIASTAVADEKKSLAPADVVSVMASRRGPIRKKCYEESSEKAETSVRIDFTVAPTGVVTDVAAHEASGPQSIVDCVGAEVKRTIFPASGTGGRFRWPFIFKGP